MQSWDVKIRTALLGVPGDLTTADRVVLNNLREDYLTSGFPAFKNRVTNIIRAAEDAAEVAKYGFSPNAQEEGAAKNDSLAGALRGLQQIQQLLLANAGASAATTPPASLLPAVPTAATLSSTPTLGHSEPRRQSQVPVIVKAEPFSNEPGVRGGSCYTSEEHTDRFLQDVEEALASANMGVENRPRQGRAAMGMTPSASQGPRNASKPRGHGQNQQLPGNRLRSMPQNYGFKMNTLRAPTIPTKLSSMRPLAQQSTHGLRQQLPLRPASNTYSTYSTSPFDAVCPFDLLDRLCPRDDYGHVKYPCDGKKICKRGSHCQSAYCGDLHIKRTCKAFVHNGKCNNEGRCSLGHDSIAERRQVADRAKAHEKGKPFVPSGGNVFRYMGGTGWDAGSLGDS
jgi:hypothetical protein